MIRVESDQDDTLELLPSIFYFQTEKKLLIIIIILFDLEDTMHLYRIFTKTFKLKKVEKTILQY